RLGARYVDKKGGALVGFRERRSSYITEMVECHVLPARISVLISPLRALVQNLGARARVPQIEVAVGDDEAVLVIRHLDPLSEADQALVKRFALEHAIHVWLQPAGPESARPFHPPRSELDCGELYYDLPEFGLRLRFGPTDFTQVNQGVNRILVSRAVRLLDPQPGERIADLFCGLGNFSLPLATR